MPWVEKRLSSGIAVFLGSDDEFLMTSIDRFIKLVLLGDRRAVRIGNLADRSDLLSDGAIFRSKTITLDTDIFSLYL
jgi:hypothetical protein